MSSIPLSDVSGSKKNRSVEYMGVLQYLKVLWSAGLFANIEMAATFPQDWGKSRRISNLILGIPVCLFVLVLVYVLLIKRPEFKGANEAEYRKLATEAYEAGEYDAAQLFFRRIAEEAGNVDARYGYARCVEKTMGREFAVTHMQDLAWGKDSERDLRPHFWLTEYYGNQAEGEQNSDKVKRHLEQILKVDPENYSAGVSWANLLLAEGNVREATEQLARLSDDHPQLLLRLAMLYEQLGADVQLRRTVEEGIEQFSALVDDAPGDVELHALLAQFLVKDNRFAEALKRLDKFQDQIAEEDRDEYTELVVRCLLAWYGSLKSQPSALPQRIELAQQMVSLNPSHPGVLVALAELSGEDEHLEDSVSTQVLQQALANGTAPEMVHFVLGSAAYRRSDLKAAERHWDLAFAKSGKLTPLLLNNLAMVYAEQAEPDLDHALELANQAVEVVPQLAEFRDTRGQIHAKRGDWKSAILDLQIVVRHFPNRKPVLELLAKAYEELGDNDVAAAYRRRVESLDSVEANVDPETP